MRMDEQMSETTVTATQTETAPAGMTIGIPREPDPQQKLVVGTPDTVKRLIKLGYQVRVEAGAGARALYRDRHYEEAGAEVTDQAAVWGSDIVLTLDAPPADRLDLMKPGAVLISRLNPSGDGEVVADMERRGLTALAMDMMPRISRAQSMDVRSSLMNVAGYRAVIEAANAFERTFGGQVTAAGRVAPARVYVIGVGVAGLAAIGAAGSLGAEVFATDVRPEVADQVKSLGGTFVEIPVKQQSSDGYAQALDEEQQKLTLEVYTREAIKSDIVITTARVPGRPSPLLVTEEAVVAMRSGSIIVDMGASELGGNCALSQPDQAVTTENGVTILGYTDLPGRMAAQVSQLYGQNLVNFLQLCTPERDGRLALNEDDAVVRGVTVTIDGQSMWPPPPVKVSASPQEKPSAADAGAQAAEATAPAKKGRGLWWKVLLAVLAAWLIVASPVSVASHYIVFALAVVVGFYVITNVTHTLHTPLMSETNAISGIIIVGAVLLIGSDNPVVVVLSFIAMAIASINIFGGFLVTQRMLKMFERSSEDR